jgi:hypothetical protein
LSRLAAGRLRRSDQRQGCRTRQPSLPGRDRRFPVASNIPVLAWDFGIWADPLWKLFSRQPIRASSVPFFSDSGGERFGGLTDFEAKLDRFMHELDFYQPRDFVRKKLSQEESANLYARIYFSILMVRR